MLPTLKPQASDPVTEGSPVLRALGTIVLRYPVYILLAGLLLGAAAVTPAILSIGNILLVLRQFSVLGIMAIGVTFVILVGRLDVSVGSLLSLLVVVIVALHDIVGPIAAMLAGIAIAAAVGAINGYLVAYLRLNSLVTTLGAYAALQGAANVASAGGLQLVKNPDASWFGFFGRSYLLGVPTPVWIFALTALIAALLLRETNFGRAVRAVGGNELASVYSSINAKATIFTAYVISALLTAVAAIVLSSRAMSAQSDSGAGLEISVLSAIFLGGTSLGVGGIGRTVLGVVVLAFISNAMILVGLPIQAQWLASAVVIILAVWLDSVSRRNWAFA
jgi:ribose/xylose/arabinose/galactoside ABC-type transport system permease subunit